MPLVAVEQNDLLSVELTASEELMPSMLLES